MATQNYLSTISDNDPAPIVHNIADGLTVYFGYAYPKTSGSDPLWRILKQTESSDGSGGTIVTISAPNGDYKYSYKWDERLTYTYQR